MCVCFIPKVNNHLEKFKFRQINKKHKEWVSVQTVKEWTRGWVS